MIIAALIMGFLGSLHCIGMCGPLAISLSSPGNGASQSWWHPIRYNAGRIFTYTLMGVVVALLGEPFRAAGLQQAFSIIGGIIMLLAALGYLIPLHVANTTNPITQSLARLRSAAFTTFKQAGKVNRFVLGMLNGLLPCGMVYMAIGGAAMQQSFTSVVSFMMFFGIGTFPTMMAMGYSTSWLNPRGMSFIKRVYPYAMLCVAVLLVLRGMNLGIPYISPMFEQTVSGCTTHCCH